MDLRIPIMISDELSEEVIEATGLLDMASGEIHRVEYKDYDASVQGLPWESADYEFSCGIITNRGRDVEFRIDVNRTIAATFVFVPTPSMLDTRVGRAISPNCAAKRPPNPPMPPRTFSLKVPWSAGRALRSADWAASISTPASR